MRWLLVLALVLGLATACGSGASGSLTATFTGGTAAGLDQPCVFGPQAESFYHLASIDSGDHVGIEAGWLRTAVTGPGTYQDEVAGELFFSVLYPDPADPSEGELHLATGSITFTAYDPSGGVVAGSFAWTFADPAIEVTGQFECRE